MFPAMKRFALAVPAVTLVLAMLAAPASAAVGEWVDGGKARIRLIAAGVDAAGRLQAGIEIVLDPGWKTYWRSPGDAGIAPAMDFSSSHNVGPVDVAFPVPERHDDGTSVTNVYEGRVVLPLSAELADPKAAGNLAVKLDIGVCAEVCIPDHFEASLDVGATPDPAAAATLDVARSLLPAAPQPGSFAVDKVWRDVGTDKRPVFDLQATLPDAKGAAVFVEGPGDWYPDVPALLSSDGTHAVYRVTFDRLVSKTAIAGAKLRVTIVSAGRAIEQWVGLD